MDIKAFLMAITVMVLLIGGMYFLERKNNGETAQENDQLSTDEQTQVSIQDQESKTNENNMGLDIKVTQEGSGERMTKIGDAIAVHYTGKLMDGTKFDSSVDRGTPFEFTIGKGMVIQGWEQGLLDMKVGEKRTLTIPAEMGYGARGAGGTIPPNATLIFDVELVSIK